LCRVISQIPLQRLVANLLRTCWRANKSARQQVRNTSAVSPFTGKLQGNVCNGFWALAISTYSELGQYANSPGHRAYTYCCAELAVFFPVAVTSASTHFAYPRRDDQAEYRPGWLC